MDLRAASYFSCFGTCARRFSQFQLRECKKLCQEKTQQSHQKTQRTPPTPKGSGYNLHSAHLPGTLKTDGPAANTSQPTIACSLARFLDVDCTYLSYAAAPTVSSSRRARTAREVTENRSAQDRSIMQNNMRRGQDLRTRARSALSIFTLNSSL